MIQLDPIQAKVIQDALNAAAVILMRGSATKAETLAAMVQIQKAGLILKP